MCLYWFTLYYTDMVRSVLLPNEGSSIKAVSTGRQ